MEKKIYHIIALNPGSTSTKIGYYHNDEKVWIENLHHEKDELAKYSCIQDQLYYRWEMVEKACKDHDVDLSKMDAFVGRGGGMVGCLGGVYKINTVMLKDCITAASGVPHPAMLAPQICRKLADEYGVPAFTVNSPDTDELMDIARISGLKGLYRQSHCHCLNQKEVAYRFCKEHGLKYKEADLLVAHFGGGVSVTVHHNGRMIDTSDSLIGDGPMTPTRAGILPNSTVLKMAYSSEHPTMIDLETKLIREGGLIDHLGTSDMQEIMRRINEENDEYAKRVVDGMAYQFAKTIGMYSVVMKGKFDAILMTGGVARCDYVIDKVKEYVDWIAPVYVYPGELEVAALAAGAYRALIGEEEILEYDGKPIFEGFHSDKYGI